RAVQRPVLPARCRDPPLTPDIYTLSLHDALPILAACPCPPNCHPGRTTRHARFGCHYQSPGRIAEDWSSLSSRTSRRFRQAIARSEETRLNSSHVKISYAVFCLKKKHKQTHGSSV